MSVTRNDPLTIFLGGERTQINVYAAAAAIKPGMLVELDDVSGTVRWKVATADIDGPPAFATEMAMMNKGVDDAYAAADLMEVSIGAKGSWFWGRMQSGQTVAAGDLMCSAGGGYLKIGATVARFYADETKTAAFTGDTMIRVTVK